MFAALAGMVAFMAQFQQTGPGLRPARSPARPDRRSFERRRQAFHPHPDLDVFFALSGRETQATARPEEEVTIP
jgi:hypothetical protein